MIAGAKKEQNKARLTYIFLALTFVLSLFISSNFVAERVSKTLAELQSSHTELKQQLTFDNLDQFLTGRIKVIESLANEPTVISSVMGIELAAANLTDMLNDYTLLGTAERIYLVDFTGAEIYSNSANELTDNDWFEPLMSGQNKTIVSLLSLNSSRYFRVATGVSYNGSIEGVLVFDIISTPLNDMFASIINDPLHGVSIVGFNSRFTPLSLETHYDLHSEQTIADYNVVLKFYTSRELLEQEKEQYRQQIGITLALVLMALFAFLLVVLRSFVLNPLKYLAISERHAKRSEERYQLAVEGSNDGIWDWDLEQDKAFISNRIARELGYSFPSDNIVSDPLSVFIGLIHPKDLFGFKRQLVTNMHKREYDFELRLGNRSDDYDYYRIRGKVQWASSKKRIRMAGSISNVTAQKQQRNALQQALEQAEQANQAKTEFLANMSHEIRTPMNGVVGTLQLLKQEQLNEEAETLLNTGIMSAKTLLTIINDILDLSKIESGMLELEEVETDIRHIFEAVVSELGVLAAEQNVNLQLVVSEHFYSNWHADPVRLKQVLVNLVSNAIKFSCDGSVTVALKSEKNKVTFAVTDTGIGMSEQQMASLFARFEQADSSTTRKYGGTGLGLAITKQLVELMAGNIKVQSEVAKGSEFTVELPLQKAQNNNVEQAQKQKQSVPQLQGIKVLLAEDNAVNRQIFQAMIKPTNANVELAFDGQQAIDIVAEYQPDVIFMDIQMPNVDGIQACKAITKMYPKTPIYALTANVMQADVERYQEVGFDGHLGKPLDMNKLYLTLHSLFSKP